MNKMNKKRILNLITLIIVPILVIASFSVVIGVTRTEERMLEDRVSSIFGFDEENYDDSPQEFSIEKQKELEKLGITMAFGKAGEVFYSEEFEQAMEEFVVELQEFISNPIFETFVVGIMTIIIFAVVVKGVVTLIRLIAKWKIHTKAGKPGWAVLLPVYRNVIIFEVAGISPAFLLLYYVFLIPFFGLMTLPLVKLALNIVLAINISKKFKKPGGFALGLIFLPTIFYAILGFGKSKYEENEIVNKKTEVKKNETIVKEETKTIVAEVTEVEEAEAKTEEVETETEVKEDK